MRLTIIKDDSTVIIDGVYYEVDVSALPSGLHALQWYETRGEIEWKDENGKMTRNEEISSITDYQWIIDAWNVKKEEYELSKTTFSSLDKFL
jgi:hypothetical protein